MVRLKKLLFMLILSYSPCSMLPLFVVGFLWFLFCFGLVLWFVLFRVGLGFFVLSDLASTQEVKDFLRRIEFHQNLGHHENLVELLGCCVDQLPLYMIMEDVSLGDLLTFLWTCRKVSQKRRYSIITLNFLGTYPSISHSPEVIDDSFHLSMHPSISA